MKRALLLIALMAPISLQAQDFLTPDTWWFDDTIMPLNDYRYQYKCDEHQTSTGILAWQNDTIAFAEYRHYEYYRLYVMKAPRHWVKTLEQLADAATMTANHFVGEWMGISLTQLRVPGRAVTNNSPTYGRALQLDSLMNKITTSVMQNDSASMYWHIIAASNLGRSFRSDYPLSWYRPTILLGYMVSDDKGGLWFPGVDGDRSEMDKRNAWLKSLLEQHDLFRGSTYMGESPLMGLKGRYLKVYQYCDRDVDSAMIVSFVLDRREEFVALSRTLFVNDHHPCPVEIILNDTVTQRQCFVNEWHCYMLLPTSDRLTDIVPPTGQGYFLGTTPASWLPEDEQKVKKWWKWWR